MNSCQDEHEPLRASSDDSLTGETKSLIGETKPARSGDGLSPESETHDNGPILSRKPISKGASSTQSTSSLGGDIIAVNGVVKRDDL
jgi:hypothetical protein